MQALQAMAAEARRLGCLPGESAKQWRARDPEAAERFAKWIAENMQQVTKEIAACVA